MATRKLFDTDGVRGVTNKYPMTVEMALRIGKATAHVLAKGKKRPKIIIGKDTRISGYMFETALTAGLCSMGAKVLLVGPIPTPAIAHLVRSFAADAGIMITASHNPAGHNGIKIFSSDGLKLPDAKEEKIEHFILDAEPTVAPSTEIGKAYRIDDARGRYSEYIKGCIDNAALSGLKVVLDCANGAAYSIAPQVMAELGAEVIVLNCQPDGLNINSDCGATYPEVIQEAVRKEKADCGIALDGDADRIIMCDEHGDLVNGDAIMAILARDMMKKGTLAKKTLVATQYSNLGLDRYMESLGVRVERVLNGDRYVIEKMKAEGYNLGGEQSGHIIPFFCNTTGDGTLTGLLLLKIIKEEGKTLSALTKGFVAFPQVMDSFNVSNKKPLTDIPHVMKIIKKVEERLGEDGRVLVRYSGTEMKARVMVEGRDRSEIAAYCNEIAEAIKKEVG